MSDILVSEIHQGGSATLAAAIAANVTAGATNILSVNTFYRGSDVYTLLTMSTNTTGTHAVGPDVFAADFDLHAGPTALAAWMNAQVTGLVAPSAPSLSLITAGALTGQGTGYAKITYVYPTGESAASTEASLAITDNHELQVASPAADAAGLATGYNVYLASSTGAEKKQNSSPIALGTNYTLTGAIGTSGVVAPTANGTAAKYLQSLHVASSLDGATIRAYAVMSN